MTQNKSEPRIITVQDECAAILAKSDARSVEPHIAAQVSQIVRESRALLLTKPDTRPVEPQFAAQVSRLVRECRARISARVSGQEATA